MPIFSSVCEHRKRLTVNLHRFSCIPSKQVHLVHMISGFAFHTTTKKKKKNFWCTICLESKHAKKKMSYGSLLIEKQVISNAQSN